MMIPRWHQFLSQHARVLGIQSNAWDTFEQLEQLIVSETSQLYFDDAVYQFYGPEGPPTPLRRVVGMVPYLTRDVVATTGEPAELAGSFVAAGRSHLMAGPSLPRQFSGLRDINAAVLLLSFRDDDADQWLRFAREAAKKKRTFLFLGRFPAGFALFDVLKEEPAEGPHFALLDRQTREGESIRRLYARNIRPVWYDRDSTQLEYLLIRMAEAIKPPVMPRPRQWPVQQPPSNAVSDAGASSDDAPTTGASSAEERLPAPVPPQEVVDALMKKECVAFVGSGLSARAGLPTWRGFVEGLVNEAVALGLMAETEAGHQLAALDGGINAVADNAISAFSGKTDALLAYYRRALTPAQGVPTPPVFAKLREIPFASVLTTNYDDLLSKTYADTDYKLDLTPRDSSDLLSLQSAENARFLLKLYGDLSRPDTVTFGPGDYQDMVRSNAAFSRFIEGLFFSRTMLFVGTSLEGLVDYLSAFRFPSGVPRKHYALIAVGGVGWQAMAQTLKRRYNIEVLPFSISLDFSELDTFLAELARRTANAEAVHPLVPETGPRLQRVELRNIGPFRYLDLRFETLWRVLLGDNGVGKSTILKGIAIAIAGSESQQYAARVLRAGETSGSVTLYTQKNPSGYVAEIQRVGEGAEVITRSGRVLETEGWVAMAFPPLRATSFASLRGPQVVGQRYATAADVMPILTGEVDKRMDDFKQWLVNLDALSRKDGPEQDGNLAARKRDSFFEIFNELIEGELNVRFKEVTKDFRVLVETSDGVLPIELLSTGLTSLLGWTGALVQRLYEVSTAADPRQDYALVLMDEIDAHLHPSWQQELLRKLKKLLPNVQIIATTHSPLVVGGLDVKEITRFVRDGDTIDMPEIEPDMMEGRADQILTGDLFGMDSTFVLNEENDKLLSEYKELLAKGKRSKGEQRRYLELHKLMQEKIPPAEETKLERRAQALVHAVLEADYSSDNREKLRDDLLEKTRAVMRSMDWAPDGGDEVQQ
jgi:hypothetical protein